MSLNNTTLTKVTYGKYATRVPDEVAYGIYEWFIFHNLTREFIDRSMTSGLSHTLYLNSLVYHRNIFGSSSEIFGNLRKSSEIFGKCSGTFV